MELSEEEKKAIEYLKENSLVRIENEKIVAYGNSYKLVLLNLIEKQQKEIKELKEKNTQLTNYLNDSYYVSADKIREKIEHYNNELEHIKNGEEFENEKPMYYWGKVALETLLEEN